MGLGENDGLGSGKTIMIAPGDVAEASHDRLLAAEREVLRLNKALREAQDREEHLLHETQRRVRNVFAVIRSILRRSEKFGASHSEFAGHFEGRLDAIARYQTDARDIRNEGVELEEVIRDQFQRAGCVDDLGYDISGPPVVLRGKYLELMSLVVHELTTNSIKFGALMHNGKLRVAWSVVSTDNHNVLEFIWTDTGAAPLASVPRAHGFGRRLIEEALPYQLGGTTLFNLIPGGSECKIVLPLIKEAILPQDASTRPDRESR